ncbi:MAG: lysophospholipase [Bdellovibrionales bacterium]|nr:lysophospholipase [Bdellovibrionales bacterium]
MTKHFEGHFKGFDKTELFFQSWNNKDNNKAIIVSHGIGEHSGSYEPFARTMVDFGWNVLSFDHRGHGRSDGQRGYVKSFDEFEKDLYQFISLVQKEHPEYKHLVLFGHSMGGLIASKTIIAYGQQGLMALVLSAPAWGLSLDAPEWKKKAAHYLKKYLPRLTLDNEINNEDLTRDPEFLAGFDKDPLRHNKISPRLYMGMLDSFDQIPHFLPEIKLPVLVQISETDPIINAKIVIENFEKIGSNIKRLKTYKNNKHEIYNDIERDLVFKDLNEFLNELLSNNVL